MSEIQIITRDTFEVIRKAVNQAVDLIRPTFGPASNKVIISKVLNKMVVDDGVQILRDLEFSDPVENAVLNVVRETAVKTNDRVGDGTTGASIMLQAIINEVGKLTKWDGRTIEKELKAGLKQIQTQLRKMTRQIKTQEELEKVSRVAFDDANIAKLIAKACFELGDNGVLTVDRSGTMETFMDLEDGIKIERGYVSPYMITNPQRMEGVIEKPHILLTDYRLTEANDVLPIMSLLATKNINTLVIICENIEQSALATLVVNRMQGKFNAIAINAPSNGDDRTVLLEDIALLTGAKVFSMKKGDKLENALITDLGRADRFIARKDSSVIIGPRGNKLAIQKATVDLNTAVTFAQSEREKAPIKARLARFSGKVGVIKCGAATEQEERALRYKVDDAIHATQAAFRHGVIPGAGLALAQCNTSSEILNAALHAPHEQLCRNMGIQRFAIFMKPDEAKNVVTGKKGNFLDIGVVDPVDVILAGVESAVSIASLLLTSSGMIVEPPKKPDQK